MEGNFKKWINRFNSKQDTLTEDNLGQFMDLELTTKSTPTSGDTVLGRDSVTGKAVEIPTSSLGGNGSIDVSNLVPYTGANKDVNIGANYFETSQGFKITNGTEVQYLMADGSTSTLPTDLIRGTGTIGRIPRYSASGVIGNSVIYDDGTNVGIGTVSPSQKLTVLGADNTIPALGSSGGKLGLLNGASGVGIYGVLQGVLGDGSSYLQVQRVDGIPTAYDLLLQPNGGNVGIFNTSPSEKLDIGGYVKATGFKILYGTNTQGLRADGGVFDLSTKADLENGKVPSSQLPSYVDDVLEFANLSSFPATGESGKIYIAIDTNLTYRWGGSSYVVMSSSLALGETSSTAYRGDRGKIAYDHSQATGNPHNTTKADIGLGNVDNTSDLDKPVSTATQSALNNKQDKLTNPITGTGTGTTNKISKFIANGVIGDSIIYENNNSISIGDDVSDARLRVKAQGALSTDIVFRVRNSTDTKDFLVVTGDGEVYNRGSKGNEFNTFFGEYSGINSTGGSNNAFGRSALASNTTGHANSAFGNNVLQDNTTGYINNAFGSQSLISNITGNGNNAFGYNALESNTEGNDNIAIGSSALGSNTTGDDNTAVGSNALQDNTTGNNNIAIGSSAGRSISDGTPLINATSSVFVGCNTKSSKNGNTNEIVIGQSAIGNGSNTATIGNDSTTDVYLKGITNSNGFKTPTGTPNQSLTANGGTFDLNTKADLVGGKVPSSQLPSSNKTTFTYDILVSNWSLVSGKYEAVISNSGILADSFVDVIPSNDHVDIVRDAQIYPSVLISAGSVKVYSKFLPSGTISVTVNII